MPKAKTLKQAVKVRATRKKIPDADSMDYYDDSIKRYDDTSSHSGIINPGTMCYMISSLQMLFSIVEYRDLIIGYGGDDEIINTIKNIFIDLRDNKNNEESISIDDKYRILCRQFFGGNIGEQDPHEFLSQLLDYIDTIYPGTTNLFKYTEISKTWCAATERNKHEMVEPGFQNIWSLQMLPRASTFQELVDRYSQAESPVDQYAPVGCSGQRPPYFKSIHVNDLKKYLLIQLVRFTPNYRTNVTDKNSSNVSIANDRIVVNGQTYKVNATIKHIGTTPTSGHYHCYKFVNDMGILYDDHRVYSRDSYVTNPLNIDSVGFDPSVDHVSNEHGNNTRYIFLFERVDQVPALPERLPITTDEEIARKMQGEENNAAIAARKAQEDADAIYAANLAKKQTPPAAKKEAAARKAQEDADFALAQTLNGQFNPNPRRQKFVRNRNSVRNQNTNALVTVSSQHQNIVRTRNITPANTQTNTLVTANPPANALVTAYPLRRKNVGNRKGGKTKSRKKTSNRKTQHKRKKM